MKTVYQLKDDVESIAGMQRAAIGSGPVGLRVTHGLVGSDEWWAQIQNGTLPLLTEIGVVSGFWPGQHGGGPAEFELRQANGSKSRWLCGLEPHEAGRQFLSGRPVEVQYVSQELKEAFNGGYATKVTISISLG